MIHHFSKRCPVAGLVRLVSLVLLLAMISGCGVQGTGRDGKITWRDLFGTSGAARTEAQQAPSEWRLDPEAQVTYEYLRYLDHLNRFQRLAQGVLADPHSMGTVMEEQAQAADALDAILKIKPSPDIYLDKANLYWNTPQIGIAREVLLQGMKRFPRNRRIALYLTNSYLVQNRVDDAVLVLQTYLKRSPGDVAVRRRLARILVESERYAQAMDVLKAIPPEQRDPEVLVLMARAGARLGKVREAIGLLEKAVKIDPESIEAWAELAYLQELDKRYEAAERTYARIMTMDAAEEQLREIRLRQVQLNLKLNNPDRALALALEQPHNGTFLLEAARIFLDQDFHAQAEKVLEALEEEGPLPVEAYFYQAAIALEYKKQPDKALELLAKVPEDSLHYRRSLEFRAHLLLNQGRDQEALKVIEEGKKLFPGDKELRMLEAAYLEEQGDLPEAETVLREVLAHHPEDTEALFQLGILLDRMGRTQEAVEVMERIIVLDPDHADALNYAGYTLAEMDKDLDRALVLVKSALKHKPGNGYIIDSLAWVYYKLGRLEMAWEEIRRATSAADDPVIWEHYGDIAKAMGKTDQARKGYRRALKLESQFAERVRSKLEEMKP